MTPTIAVVMDPIASIQPRKDTTLAMMLEVQRRGWPLLYLQPQDLYLRDGVTHAHGRSVEVFDDHADWFRLGAAHEGPLHELAGCVLMRKDPPFDIEYVYTTYLLDRAEDAGALVVNAPQALRDVNEKAYTAWFPQCTAPTLIACDMQRMRDFMREHGDCIAKPLAGMGGASVFRVDRGDPNATVILETLTAHGTRHAMVQRYIPEIADGDKRILLVDGEPVPYALARKPAAGETRGNLAAGGSGEGVPLTERDRWIAAQVGPALKDMGLMFVGLDVIGDYLTEVNVTSPTCVRELDAQYGINIAGMLFDVIEARLGDRSRA